MEKLPYPFQVLKPVINSISQRKTLLVFIAYCVECNTHGNRNVTAVILVSEIIELSAVFLSMCVLECLKDVNGIGSLDMLYLGLDTGTHFRSYENMFYFLYHLAETHRQKCRLNFLIEKHGGPCVIESSVRYGDGCLSFFSTGKDSVTKGLTWWKFSKIMRGERKGKILMGWSSSSNSTIQTSMSSVLKMIIWSHAASLWNRNPRAWPDFEWTFQTVFSAPQQHQHSSAKLNQMLQGSMGVLAGRVMLL